MQINAAEEQVSLFVQDLPVGRTCPGHTAHAPPRRPPAATSGKSSSRSSPSRNPSHTLMLLDLRPGAGNMLGPYWEYDPPWLGSPGTLNCSACPKDVIESSLSLILEDTVPTKYYLSRTACRGILRRAKERGKPLPVRLEIALRLQAGLSVRDELVYELTADGSLPLEFYINRREEKNIGGGPSCLTPWDTQHARIFAPEGTAPTLCGADAGGGRNPGGYVFSACFNAGAGSKAGGISYHEEFAPTLKAGQGGNMMPSVLCLNDQGGGVMDWNEDLSGTLRAQEHGHQPLVLYENHGIDARYTGPHEIAPTMSAAYGSGGNNVPLVARETEARMLFENHGQSVDYAGSLDVSSMVSAAFGIGGGNIPPMEQKSVFCISGNTIGRKPQNGGNGIDCQEDIAYTLTATDHHAVFSRQRVDLFKGSEIASTQSARQYKDAADLVYQEPVGALTGSDSKGINNQPVSQDRRVEDGVFLIRRLTPRECERLQGYPTDWTDIPGASDAARYKALGNSVAIPCVEYLMQGIALAAAAGL